jgi:hypothetical protein
MVTKIKTNGNGTALHQKPFQEVYVWIDQISGFFLPQQDK